MLNDIGKEKAAQLASAFNTLVERVDFIVPAVNRGREYSIFITKLEEASFFAKKAMAIQTANQQEIVAGSTVTVKLFTSHQETK